MAELLPVRDRGYPSDPGRDANPTHFHGLDTLRALAIVLVMLFHLQNYFPLAFEPIAGMGWAGVDLFFVLSGFLIGSQVLKPYAAGTQPSLREFYTRRAYRILPAYLVVLALYLGVPSWREAPGPYAPWQYFTFTWNLLLLGYPEHRAFSHVWSLCVEEHFYLLLPLMTLLLMRTPRVWKVAAAFTAVLLGGIVVRGCLLHFVVQAPGLDEDGVGHAFMRYLYYPTYTRLDGLAIGVFVATLRIFRPAWWVSITRHGHRTLCSGLILTGVATWMFQGDYPNASLAGAILFGFPILSIGLGLLTVAAVSDGSMLARRVPGAATVAALAYSLYLTHKSVAHLVRLLLPSWASDRDWRAFVLISVACLAVAFLLRACVEKPFMALRTRSVRAPEIADAEARTSLDPAI